MKKATLITAIFATTTFAVTAATAQTVDISSTATQTSINNTSVTNSGTVTVNGNVQGTDASVSASAIGAINEASVDVGRNVANAATLPSATNITSNLTQSATNGSTASVANSASVVTEGVQDGASVSISSVGAANSLALGVNRK